MIPAWKTQVTYLELMHHPPQGYQFYATPQSSSVIRRVSSFGLSYDIQGSLGQILPLQLLIALYRKYSSPSADVVYAVTHVTNYRRPWILDMMTELPELLVSNEKFLKHFRASIRRTILDECCKGVIFWVDAGRRAFVEAFGSDLQHKLHTVYWGKPLPSRGSHEDGNVRLLFVNSANMNIPFHFYNKGGIEAIRAFVILKQRFPRLEMTIRSGMPKRVFDFCRTIPGLKVIDRPVPWILLEKEWKSSDIFVMPNHVNTPANVLLDAMSYGLPVVTTDIWANPEIVRDGQNGLLVHHPLAHTYTDGSTMRLNSSEFHRVVRGDNRELVRSLVDSLSNLIDDCQLRDKIGKNNRREIEVGRFSLEQRNLRLEAVLDGALGEEKKTE
ncbi:MAG: glycosyltransferase family 4 protein [Nitrososphaerota archaeon]|nr:glycosyltransferase family 4 protein [Nitrososphaerota archaeon]